MAKVPLEIFEVMLLIYMEKNSSFSTTIVAPANENFLIIESFKRIYSILLVFLSHYIREIVLLYNIMASKFCSLDI